MRLLSKVRVGPKHVKHYEKEPKTPAQRVLESPRVKECKKRRSASFSPRTTFWTCANVSTPT